MLLFAGAGVAFAGVGAFFLWLSGSDDTSPPSRARQYTAFSACLLSDEHGVTGSQAAPIWAGMEDASLQTHAKVSSLPVFGPATVGNAVPYVNTLVQRHCDVVVAVGDAQTAAVTQVATQAHKVRFVVVGGGRPAGNVTVVADSPDAGAEVSRLVKAAVAQGKIT
ncbi:BMP family ABC transporter substrate-binding protein [Streptomyces sp. A1136]|uniref:BMP family ABC transporter substrate-binding protein n=1 Tax=Streptomyces sp. A1136 TaxID=2563102 RepID=UPI00109E9007|nr:BMP family ABC transporter substrate-binding protein [Streptomyces sp. A1136]THA49426.1 BMP family ABC transporter substrate-binding protein [Streptomyces sp. A1136]